MVDAGIKKVTIKNQELPALVKLTDDTYGHFLRYRIVSEDKNRFSHWSKMTPLTVFSADSLPPQVSGALNLTDSSITIVWDDEVNRPKYDIFVKFYFIVNKASLTDNVAKVHTTVNHNLIVGDTIIVSGISNPVFNGEFVITEVTLDTISYVKTNTNISQFNVVPTGTVGKDFFYHGTSPIHTYSIIAPEGTSSFDVVIQVESAVKEISDILTICELSDTIIKI
jgi:hypothetical protein